MNQRAEQLLSQYFLPSTPHSLPEPLQHWFKHQIAQLTAKGKVPSPCLPLHMEQAERQLPIRLIPQAIEVICCNVVIILYADDRIAPKIYFEED
jgi:hypothetical protein